MGELHPFVIKEIEITTKCSKKVVNNIQYLCDMVEGDLKGLRFFEKELFTAEEFKSYVNEYFKN